MLIDVNPEAIKWWRSLSINEQDQAVKDIYGDTVWPRPLHVAEVPTLIEEVWEKKTGGTR